MQHTVVASICKVCNRLRISGVHFLLASLFCHQIYHICIIVWVKPEFATVVKVKLSRYRHVGSKGERKYSSYSLLTRHYMGVSDQRHTPAALSPRERILGTHWLGDWVDLRACLDTETRGKILCMCRESNLGRLVCFQIL
jgi:hypothetical protein